MNLTFVTPPYPGHTMPERWLDPAQYPFAPHFFPVEAGCMHYVDAGTGAPVVMLHGNPTWSFLYRHLIHRLTPDYRCIAPDYLGFGRSDKPDAAVYAPSAQAARVEALITQLGLRDITLVVHDWGGPIGLSYALRHPGNVRRIVVMNSWMWPLDDDAWITLFSRLMGSALGRALTLRYNAFARFVMPLAFADRERLSDDAFRHYLAPLATPAGRMGSWMFPRALLGETEWLASLWANRAALTGVPMLIVWGMRDPAFRTRHLRRWIDTFPHAHVHPLPDVGHYVPEEVPLLYSTLVADFLG